LTLAVVAGALAGTVLFLLYGVNVWSMNLGWLSLCFVSMPALMGSPAPVSPRTRGSQLATGRPPP
jgi:hypothetical protein